MAAPGTLDMLTRVFRPLQDTGYCHHLLAASSVDDYQKVRSSLRPYIMTDTQDDPERRASRREQVVAILAERGVEMTPETAVRGELIDEIARQLELKPLYIRTLISQHRQVLRDQAQTIPFRPFGLDPPKPLPDFEGDTEAVTQYEDPGTLDGVPHSVAIEHIKQLASLPVVVSSTPRYRTLETDEEREMARQLAGIPEAWFWEKWAGLSIVRRRAIMERCIAVVDVLLE